MKWSDDENRGEGNSKKVWDISKLEKRLNNLDGFWGPDCVHRVMQREILDRMDARIFMSIWWYIYPTIQREMARDKGVL